MVNRALFRFLPVFRSVYSVVSNEKMNKKKKWEESPMMRAARCLPTDRVPIWLMRQAGRYMREYREIREKTSFLDLCKTPSLASEVMLCAVEKLGVDAGIIFSDLLLILEPMGFELEFHPEKGPVIHNPIRGCEDIARVMEIDDLSPLQYVFEVVSQTRAGLSEELPLIGFAGAPFTLAGYILEGGSSRDFLRTKSFMSTNTAAWHQLMVKISHSVAKYLNAQIEAGAQIVQIFDSWVGCLSEDDYRTYVMRHTRTVIELIRPGIPVIHFGTGNPALVPLMREAGGNVIGADWRISIDHAWEKIGYDRGIQGNLDPAVLLTDPDVIYRLVRRILDMTNRRSGHVFNLGHGVLPQTPVENAIALVQAVHELGRRG